VKPETDIVVVGAGIVGLATARALLRRPDVDTVTVLDKEDRVGAHQSSHNSGVINSGIYYPAGSAKARLVATGRTELERFCDEHGVTREACGKVVVATDVGEIARLHDLQRRAGENGIAVRLLDRRALAELEPHAAGVAALHVPSTGIVDFAGVCRALADDVVAGGGRLALDQEVVAIDEHGSGVRVRTTRAEMETRWLVNCAGLQSDLVAAMGGIDIGGVRIMPFRGEYHDLVPERRALVRNLIYPVPDPRFPFLGVHFTRMVDGRVHAGPNAVAALAREGYRWSDHDRDERRRLVNSPASRVLAARHWRTGAGEIVRSLSRRALVRSLRRLVPEIGADDLVPADAGVRAQALAPDGALLDDFVFAESSRMVSVVNAPSPAATASLAIGRAVADRLATRFE
jgi:L-2-hydroxyglutarate oxidase